jgi:hypothetical protein
MQIFTITTDFGAHNHAVSGVKGRIFSAISDCQVVDLSHAASKFNLQQAAYIFKSSYLNFPEGTVHFVFNNLHENKNQQLIYVCENGHHIFCPDNGFITLLFHDQPIQIYKLTEKLQSYNFITVTDLFLGNVALLNHGQEMDVEIVSVDNISFKKPHLAFYQNNILDAQVLYIDYFGNVVLNVTKDYFEQCRQGRNMKIHFMRQEEINVHYNDVDVSQPVCLFNTSNHLEIAINQGNAAQLFGFFESTDRSLFYNSIKIFFE